MAFVWNILLSFDNEELWEDGEDAPRATCEPFDRINAWLSRSGRLVDLIGPTYEGDVGNGLDANLFGGGFKHFDIDGFIEVVRAQRWKKRSKVQLWIKGAEEGMGTEPFELVRLGPTRKLRAKQNGKRQTRAGKAMEFQSTKRRSRRKDVAKPKARLA
jgi:hypothetical protein